MEKIKAIIFDLNGIFVHAKPLSQRVEEKFGINRDFFWRKFDEIYSQTKKSSVDPGVWQPIAEMLGISVDEFLEFWCSDEKIDEEMLHLAQELKSQGLKLFLLSNNLRERTQYYRQSYPELFKVFDAAYFSWETGFVKPDPKAFESILTKNNLNPEECLYFDDSSTNVHTAINLGIKSRVFDGLEAAKNFIKENQ